MLSPIYRESLSDVTKTAFRLKDKDMIVEEILRLCEYMSEVDPKSKQFRAEVVKLLLSIAVYDSFHGGHAVALVADLINL